MKLKNQVAIVTGGSTGIGKGVAIGFAREGADVVVTYHSRSPEPVLQEIRALGRRALAVQVDLNDPESARNLVRTAYKEFGRVDILYNDAAAFSPGMLLTQPMEKWDETWNTNVRGTFITMQEAAKIMIEQGYGKIINIESVMRWRPSMSSRMAYHTSKAGIVGLTEAAAKTLGPKGVYVNAIAPGTFKREGFVDAPEVYKAHDEACSVGRTGIAEDMVGPSVFLASHDSDYVNGVCLLVDGGWAIGD